ncbi:MAG: hypothetical protein ABW223_08310 [Rariglobus sp.]
MKKSLLFLVSTAACGVAFIGNLAAQTVNVRFTNTANYVAAGPYADASGADQWHEVGSNDYFLPHSDYGLTTTTDAGTGISFVETTSVSNDFFFGSVLGNGITLFDDYAHRGGGIVMSFTISGLDASALYRLYVYSARNTNDAIFEANQGFTETGSFTVDGVTKGTSYANEQNAFIEGVNYVVFNAVTNGAGQLTFTSDAGVVNGFTLQAIPEPSAFAALAGLFVLGVTVSRRRRA